MSISAIYPLMRLNENTLNVVAPLVLEICANNPRRRKRNVAAILRRETVMLLALHACDFKHLGTASKDCGLQDCLRRTDMLEVVSEGIRVAKQASEGVGH